MKFLRSLMEAAKPEDTKSPISKADHRAYMKQIKTTFKGNEKFNAGKVKRADFADAAMAAIDDCPKNGNCDDTHKSTCVKDLWNSYKARYAEVLQENTLKEGWDESDEDRDVKIANDEVKKSKVKVSKSKEDQLAKDLEKADKKAEDKATKKVKKEKMEEGVVAEKWEESEEDRDVKIANDEAKKRGVKTLSPRAEKALNAKLDKKDRKDEDKAVTAVKKDKEAVEEGKIPSFARFILGQ